jgi:CubicO group peptidase (beta-lactamase class C family)
MLYASVNYELLGEIIRRVTGSTVASEMAKRIFDPLGIEGSTAQPDDALRDRLVELSTDGPVSQLFDRAFGMKSGDMFESDSAGGGVVSTARDHAVFQQMILGMGTLGGVRVLSKASVRAMTTNQIPGVPDIVFGNKEGSWGYGFSVICQERWPYFGGGLIPPGSATHAGSGGICWIDFENEIVAAYYEIITEISEKLEPISSAGHRFQDVITSAVID